jgi:hypothetical protein
MTLAELKREAVARALVRPPDRPDQYEVKFRGALMQNERATLAELGIGANTALIVLPARRRPAR